jgi:23S rRNA (cytosine1962-C5)-methyltransferase
MTNLVANYPQGYELIDSGLLEKVEKIGHYKVRRPCPQAIWTPNYKTEWNDFHAVCHRTKEGGGKWKFHDAKSETSEIALPVTDNLNLNVRLKLTPFGHCGVFFEQRPIWNIIINQLTEIKTKVKGPIKFLNLFGYTGVASLCAAHVGAEVFHIDSARGVLEWGRQNEKLNEFQHQIKFIQEDVLKFVKHSARKGFKYHGILADPPSWGHGANKEVWTFEENIYELVSEIYKILSDEGFFILTSHTHGVQQEALKNLQMQNKLFKSIVAGELGVKHNRDERIIPAGIYSIGSLR